MVLINDSHFLLLNPSAPGALYLPAGLATTVQCMIQIYCAQNTYDSKREQDNLVKMLVPWSLDQPNLFHRREEGLQ